MQDKNSSGELDQLLASQHKSTNEKGVENNSNQTESNTASVHLQPLSQGENDLDLSKSSQLEETARETNILMETPLVGQSQSKRISAKNSTVSNVSNASKSFADVDKID